MIKIICDKCKNDCDLNAFVITVNVIHNPNPVRYSDSGDIKLTDDNTHKRFVVCSDCYHKMQMPNPYCDKFFED